MKTLVIHPSDRTTDMLCAVYEKIPDKTVIRGGISRAELKDLIINHDRIIMTGHGYGRGLMAVRQFATKYDCIIDWEIVPLLREKTNNVYIWCDADVFVREFNLSGFYTGMFISEMSEAYCRVWNINQSHIDRSNRAFCKAAAKHIRNSTPREVCVKIKNSYGIKAKGNPVVAYNNRRLYYNNNQEGAILKKSA